MSDLSDALGAGAIGGPIAHGLDAAGLAALLPGGFDAQRRALRLHTAWGAHALLPERVSIDEGVNALFDLDLQALSRQAGLDVGELLGTEATLELQLADGRLRPFHGVVMEVGALGSDGGFARYRLRLQPWLALLAHRRDSFLFQDVTALEAIEAVLRDHPQANWRVAVTEPLRRREICTQFDETDLDFVLRLLAEEGLSFHFEHDHGPGDAPGAAGAGHEGAGAPRSRHVMVITDRGAQRSHLGAVRFHRRDATETEDALTHWQSGLRLTSAATTLGAWDPRRLAGVAAQESSARALGQRPQLERYDGAGERRYADAAHAQRAALLALQAEELPAHTARGAGSARELAAGAVFTLTQHEQDGGDYTLLAVQHEAANNLGAEMARLLGAPELEGGSYRNRVWAVPADVPVVPPHAGRPARPTAHAHWPAIVVGVAGEVLTTERDHRIKVQFPWQRGRRPVTGGLAHEDMRQGDAASSAGTGRQASANGASGAPGNAPGGDAGHAPLNESSGDPGNAPLNESSGTWLRVAVPQAGPDWGAVLVPRIGCEVLVGFIEGDIDRPVVVQALHNGQDTPPFPAGEQAAANHPGVIGGWHTAWLDGAGCNQWLLDDATGQLRMRLHCSHALSELAVGHLIQQAADAVNTSAWRGAWRGAGFELTTQGWATLRAAGGLLVTTAERSGAGSHGSAESTQMDATEAVAQMHAAQALAQALSDSARGQGAQPLAGHAQSIPELIRGLDAQQEGRCAGPVNGQAAIKGQRPGVTGVSNTAGAASGNRSQVETHNQPGADADPSADLVERPAAPTLTLDAAHSSLLATDSTLAAYAGGDFALVSQGDAHAAAAHTASTVVGGTASHYTHAGGMKLIAANGPVSLRAHTGALDLQAEQALTLTSVGEEIHATAQGRLVLTAGSSQVVLDGANLTFNCPGTFTVKAAAHAFEGGAATPAALTTLPSGVAQLADIATPLQAAFSESLDLSGIPDDWLPVRLGTSVLARQGAQTLEVGTRGGDGTAPLAVLTDAPQEVQYWHQTGAAWTVEESIDIGTLDETDDGWDEVELADEEADHE
jgi:type VI secretion system secreted protein VgrG